MNPQSHLKRTLFAVVLGAATTVVAETANICQLTSQDGLNSSKVFRSRSGSRTRSIWKNRKRFWGRDL